MSALGPRAAFVILIAAILTMSAMTIDINLPAIPATASAFDTSLTKAQLSVSLFFVGFAAGPGVLRPALGPLRPQAGARSRHRRLSRGDDRLRAGPLDRRAARRPAGAGPGGRQRPDSRPRHHSRPVRGCRDGTRDVAGARRLHHGTADSALDRRADPRGRLLARHLLVPRDLRRRAARAGLGLPAGEPADAGSRRACTGSPHRRLPGSPRRSGLATLLCHRRDGPRHAAHLPGQRLTHLHEHLRPLGAGLRPRVRRDRAVLGARQPGQHPARAHVWRWRRSSSVRSSARLAPWLVGCCWCCSTSPCPGR